MHLTRLLLLNSGPTERLSLELPFHSDGRPKPVLIVGTNGAGKTNLLSVVADGLMELAATVYEDALPRFGAGHKYYRMSGGRTRRARAAFDLAALHFRHDDTSIYFRNATGEIPFDQLTPDLEPFGAVSAHNRSEQEKIPVISEELARKVFQSGAYLYFPSSRHEIPHWLNEPTLERDPPVQFSTRYASRLDNPLVLPQGLAHLKPWIVDLFLDQAVDARQAVALIGQGANAELPQNVVRALQLSESVVALNGLLSIILGTNARFVRATRQRGDRRVQIYFGETPALPNLDALSAGQSTLLSIFGNLLRLGTIDTWVSVPASAKGIVLVDEIDAHLHADLQYDALPRLIAAFPNLQFIVTCHSPLFPLGMQKQLSVDGFQLLEMPNGIPISCERYSEFRRSFEMYSNTRAFEEHLKRLGAGGKPIVIGEGKTDPQYLRAAAEILGYADLVSEVEFRWIGELDETGKQSSGQGQLKKAVDIYRATLPLLGRRVCCLFDQKSAQQVSAEPFTKGFLAVRSLPLVPNHPFSNDGPENLLPPALFEERFLTSEEKELSGTKRVIVRDVNKVALANHVCNTLRNPADFENFRPVLEELRAFLLAPLLSPPFTS